MSRLDRGLLLAIFTLMGIGIVQVYSASFVFAMESRGNGLYFFERQLAFAVIAILVLFATAFFPFRMLEKAGWLLWLGAAVGVAATFVPHLGMTAGGAARWLRFPGGFVFEPSELLRISLPLLVATFFSRRFEIFKNYDGVVRAVILCAPLVLLLKQPDFGSFFICSVVFLSLLFAYGLQWRFVIAAIAGAIPALYLLVMRVPYRRARVFAFLDPWADPEQKGFQIIQSMLSFQSGHLTGAGLGQGEGKLFFLPEAHTDFTLAVLGEEMGFIGIFVVLSLYGFLVFRGIRISVHSQSRYGQVLALGLSLTFALSVFINSGVVMGMLPTKGLTLPFLSYGGSSLIMTCFLFGLLLNVERHSFEGLPIHRSSFLG